MANTIYHELMFAIMIKYKILDLKYVYVETNYDWTESPSKMNHKYLKDVIDIDSYIEDYSQETGMLASDLKEFIVLMNTIENEIKEGNSLSKIYVLRSKLYSYTFLPLPPIPTLRELASSALFFSKNRKILLTTKALSEDLKDNIKSTGDLFIEFISQNSDCDINPDNEIGILLQQLFLSIKNPSEELNSQIMCAVTCLNFTEAIQYLGLKLRPLSVNVNYSENGLTSLHMAVEVCDLNLCKFFIKLRANVNILTDDSVDEKSAGLSPLATAVQLLTRFLSIPDMPLDKISRAKEIIQFLLLQGANPNLEGQQGYSAMNTIAACGQLIFSNLTDENKMILKDTIRSLMNGGGDIDKLLNQRYKDLINSVLRYHPTPFSDEITVHLRCRPRSE